MNKNILITGAASGIGKRLTERLLAAGAGVCATDVDEAGLADLNTELGCERLMVEKLDVRDPVQWAALYERIESELGRLDIALHSAGVCKPGYVQDTSPADVDLHFDINAKGVMHGTRFAAQHLMERGSKQLGGHIINIASLAGITPVSGLTLYSASKFAVRGFSLAAAYDLEEHGIKVTAVCPDAVATPMVDLQLNYEEAALTFSGGKILTVDEVCDNIINKVIAKQPLEVTINPGRGLIAKIASFWPNLARFMLRQLRKKGLEKQAELKG